LKVPGCLASHRRRGRRLRRSRIQAALAFAGSILAGLSSLVSWSMCLHQTS
jgi:hypothetical protein